MTEPQDDNRVRIEDVVLTGPTAHRLGDMAGVQLDLRWTAGACKQMLRRQQVRNPDLMGIHALHDAALIRYARCFKAGRRDAFQIPDEWLKGLPAPLRQAHRDALSLRDKHIAHSINDWEVNVPVAVLARTKVAATVRSIEIRQMRMMMLGTDPLESLHELAKTLADRVVVEMQQLQREILAELRGTPPRELQRRAPRVFPTPGRRKVGSDRGRR